MEKRWLLATAQEFGAVMEIVMATRRQREKVSAWLSFWFVIVCGLSASAAPRACPGAIRASASQIASKKRSVIFIPIVLTRRPLSAAQLYSFGRLRRDPNVFRR